ncbi:MAG: prenyltransferase/squalene oxidase repeat-containing protein [bacterium]
MIKQDEIIGRAISFLLNARNGQGVWSDFLLPVGESSGWVTGFVGSVLTGTGDDHAAGTATEVWNSFAAQKLFTGDGGWGYNLLTPEDADSTAWGIRFALGLGLEGKLRTELAEDFLEKHLTADGGITTYILEQALRKLIGANSGEDISGWTVSHVCVTAAAAAIPRFTGILVPYLLKHQTEEGNWNAYWWSDPVYATALATESLVLNGRDAHKRAIDRSLSWVLKQLGPEPFVANGSFPDGSPFATAMALKTMLLGVEIEKIREKASAIARWLISRQREDGSWQPSALLQVPPPYMKIPVNPEIWVHGKGAAWGTVITDQQALFTTAAVLDALVHLRRLMPELIKKTAS